MRQRSRADHIMILTRNGRSFVVLVGLLVCLATLRSQVLRQEGGFCLFDRCAFATSASNTKDTAGVVSGGISSPVLGLGGLRNPSQQQHQSSQPHQYRPLSSPSFSQDTTTTEIDLSLPSAPFISWPLARLCTEKPTVPNLVFICDNNSGGIGNIRNFILTCLRYAIEAGADGIILPTIQTRHESKLNDLFRGKRAQFGDFFDEGWFRSGLGEACPGLKIHGDLDEVEGKGEGKIEKMTPNQLFGSRGGCDSRDLNRHTDLFGQRFRGWLLDDKRQQDDRQQTKLIRFNWGVQWDWPVHRDGPEFVATFGGLLRFRADILELGMKTVAMLEKKQTGKGGGYLGVHLRTENDALSNWPSFDEQARAYLSRAKAHTSSPRLNLAYLATGNISEAARFASLAAAAEQDAPIQVLTKQQLLQGEDTGLEELNQLSWDQQALVDFVVLLHAEYFIGVSPSSFSMNVALKRHLHKEGIYTRPWRVGSEEGDGRSWLVGRYEHYWDDWLFMYDSLWP